MSNLILTFHNEENVTLTTDFKTFKEAIQFVLERKEPTHFKPIKIVLQSTGETLYFDESKFKAFLDDEFSEAQIVEATKCDGLFRNLVDVEISNQGIIDSGSLWMLKDDDIILIDQDRYVFLKAPDSNFIEI